MPHSIRIRSGGATFAAELNDSTTAETILAALPLEGAGNRWGGEIYFLIDVNVDLALDSRAEMAVGELAYWPPGNAFCIFFGPTPASVADESRAASPANPVGRILGDIEPLKTIHGGTTVVVEEDP